MRLYGQGAQQSDRRLPISWRCVGSNGSSAASRSPRRWWKAHTSLIQPRSRGISSSWSMLRNRADCFSREDIRALTRRAEEIERTAYERFLDHVLELARTAARREGGLELPPLLKAINEIVAQLRRLGIDAEASERLKTKLGILRDTSAAGKSAKAKNFKLTGPTQSYKGDHRLYVRYRDPALHIVLHGRRYQTVDWSLGGLLVGEVESLFAPIGTLIELRIGIEESQMHAERATIVRFSANRHELALQFRRFGSAMINIKRECEALGLTPR